MYSLSRALPSLRCTITPPLPMACVAGSMAVSGMASESYDGCSTAQTLSIGAATVATPSTTELPVDITCSFCGVTIRTSGLDAGESQPVDDAHPQANTTADNSFIPRFTTSI